MSTQPNSYPAHDDASSNVTGTPLGYPAIAPTRSDLGRSNISPVQLRTASAPLAGSPQATSAPKADATRQSPPMPKRPRGRIFIALILLALFGGFGFALFENYLHYGAYGEVTGRKIQLSTPWDGVVSQLNVRVGDKVREGDVLFRVESLALRHRMDEIKDELELERSRLGAEISRLKWEAQRVTDQDDLIKADYYEKWSELLWEQSVQADLQQQVDRAVKLRRQDAISEEKLVSLISQLVGQEHRVDALSEAVASLKERTKNESPTDPEVSDQVKPVLTRIENLQSELVRTRQVLDQGDVKSPINAIVTRVKKYSGEQAVAAEDVVELLVDGSTEIVLYVPQRQTQHWVTGDRMEVKIAPHDSSLLCEIAHLGPEMTVAPRSIMRHYAADEALLPIVMRPVESNRVGQLIIGSKVRLPRLAIIAQSTTQSLHPADDRPSTGPVARRSDAPELPVASTASRHRRHPFGDLD